MRFWDASAIVPLLVEEPMSQRIKTLLLQDHEVALWWGTRVECASALARSAREHKLDGSGVVSASRLLKTLSAGAYEIQPAEEVRRRAERLLRVHSLRAADALQLAAALIWCSEQTSAAAFLSLDKRLGEAASLEGFNVLPQELDR